MMNWLRLRSVPDNFTESSGRFAFTSLRNQRSHRPLGEPRVIAEDQIFRVPGSSGPCPADMPATPLRTKVLPQPPPVPRRLFQDEHDDSPPELAGSDFDRFDQELPGLEEAVPADDVVIHKAESDSDISSEHEIDAQPTPLPDLARDERLCSNRRRAN